MYIREESELFLENIQHLTHKNVTIAAHMRAITQLIKYKIN